MILLCCPGTTPVLEYVLLIFMIIHLQSQLKTRFNNPLILFTIEVITLGNKHIAIFVMNRLYQFYCFPDWTGLNTNVLSREITDRVILAVLSQTPHSGYVTLCYFNHCQHKNHVTMLYHVIDSNLQPLFTTHTAL